MIRVNRCTFIIIILSHLVTLKFYFLFDISGKCNCKHYTYIFKNNNAFKFIESYISWRLKICVYTHPFLALNSPKQYVVLKQTISEKLRLDHLPENTSKKAALFTKFHVNKQKRMIILSTLTQTLLISVGMLLLCLRTDYTGHRFLWKRGGAVGGGEAWKRANTN